MRVRRNRVSARLVTARSAGKPSVLAALSMVFLSLSTARTSSCRIRSRGIGEIAGSGLQASRARRADASRSGFALTLVRPASASPSSLRRWAISSALPLGSLGSAPRRRDHRAPRSRYHPSSSPSAIDRHRSFSGSSRRRPPPTPRVRRQSIPSLRAKDLFARDVPTDPSSGAG
jgi:hypothetical protein